MEDPKEKSAVSIVRVSGLDIRKDQEVRQRVQGIVLEILKSLVLDPATVSVRFSIGDRTTVFHVDCLKVDIGRVIGVKGANIDALRILVRSMMGASGIRAVVEIPYYAPEKKLG